MTVSRDIRLSVTAEVSKYVAEMAKIPGTTQKQANAAGRALAKELAKAEVIALKDARKAAAAGAKSWKDAFKPTNVAGNLITAAAFKQAAAAIKDLVVNVVDLRNELGDMATRTDIAVETLAGLRLAARGSGLEFSELERALAGLPKRMLDASRGTGEAMVAFDALKISVTDQNDELRRTDEFFRDFISRLGEVESPTERAALATQALGVSGTKLLQALGDPAALQTFIDLAVESGDVSLDGAAAASEWQRSTAELQTVIEGFKGELFDTAGATEFFSDAILGTVFTTKLITEQIKRAREEIHLTINPVEALGDSLRVWTVGLAESGRTALEASQRFKEQRDAIREATAATEDGTDATGDNTDTKEGAIKAAREASAAERAYAKALRQAERDAKAYAKALTTLAGISDAATEDLLSDEERIQAGLEERLVQIRRLERAALALATSEAEASDIAITAQTARAEATKAADRERVESRREAALQINEVEDELARKDAERTADNLAGFRAADEERTASAKATSDAIIQAFAEVANQALDFADDMVSIAERRNAAELAARQEFFAGDKAAQNEAFEFAKKRAKQLHAASVLIALAKIAVDTAINTVALIALMGPIAGPAFAVASGAIAAAAVIATPAPALHAGGPVDEAVGGAGGLDPDEVIRRLRRSESVLTARGTQNAGGAEGVRRLNSGGNSGSVTINLKLRHKTVDRVVHDLSNRPSLTNTAMTRGRRPSGVAPRVIKHTGESA